MNTSQDFIKKLQQERTDYKHASQVRMQAKSLMQLSVGIYTEPERFVYELLQNAVDAFSDIEGDTLNILIKAEDDRFIFMHNGKEFDSKDVEGVCDVGNGTKSKDNRKIGYKGIGFKSVFMPSVDHVSIISGQFCFEFDKQTAYSLMPTFPPSEGVLEPEDVPWQVIPIDAPHLRSLSVPGFNVITVVYTKDANNIASQIENLFSNLQFLLFLSSNNVNISFERNGQLVLSVGKEQFKGNCNNMSKVTLKKNGQQQSNWMLYTKNVTVPSEVKSALEHDFNTPDKLKGVDGVQISFAVQTNKDHVIPLKNTSVFTFLPTSYRALRQPFLINSNFITDAGRQQLHQESEWNKFIFKKIPDLYLDFVSIFSREYNNYTEVLPTIYPDNDTLVGIYRRALQDAFKSIAFVPNRNGNMLLKIGDVLVDKTGISKDIIPVEQILKYLNKQNDSVFNDDSFVENDGIEEYARNQINLFDSEELLLLLADKETILNISIQDNIKLIKFLHQFFKQSPFDSYKEKLANTSIFYDTGGILRCINELFFPSDFEEQNKEMSDVAILNEDIYENIKKDSSLIKWLKYLGLRELSKVSFIEYLFTHHDYITVENALSIGRFIFSVWKQENFLENVSYSEDIKNLCFLAKDGQLRPICNLYLGSIYRPEDDMEQIIQRTDLYISNDYPENDDIEDWSFFLKKCGAMHKIGIAGKDYKEEELDFDFIKKTAKTFSEYDHPKKWYLNFPNPIINIHFQVFYFTFIDYNNPIYELDKYVFSRILSKNRTNWHINDKVYGKVKYWGDRDPQNFGKIEKSLNDNAPYEYKCKYNSILEYVIANKQKFPTTQGNSKRPSEVFINDPVNTELGGKYLPILAIGTKVHESWRSILPFKQHLTTEDLLDILEGISVDKETEKEQKKERVSKIYKKIIERDEQSSIAISEWSKSHKILSQSGEFLPAHELTYITVDGFKNGGHKVFCENIGKDKQDKKLQMLKTFGVRVITQNDIKTNFENQIEDNELKNCLLEKLQYLAILKDNEKIDFEAKKNVLREKILSTHFYKCDSISLTYGEANDTITRSTYSKGLNFYYTGKITPALMEPMLSPLCTHLNLGGNNDSKLMVILITGDHHSLVHYLSECGYDIDNLKLPREMPKPKDKFNQQPTNDINELRFSQEKISQNSSLEDAHSITQDVETKNNPNIPIIEKGNSDGIGEKPQWEAQLEAQKRLMQEFPQWIFPSNYGEADDDGRPYNFSTIEIEDENYTTIPIVLKSYKNNSEPFKINTEEWDYLIKEEAVLLIYTGDDVKRVYVRDLIRKQSRITITFSTENLDIEDRVNAFADSLHYFNELHFDFESFNISSRVQSAAELYKKNKRAFLANHNTEEDI